MGAPKRAVLASLLLAALATQAFVAVSARSGPTDKATQDDVKKPDCVPALDPRSWPGGHPGTTVPLPSHGGSSGSSSPPYHGGSGTTPSHGSSSGSSPPYHGGSGTSPSHGGSGSIPDPSHGGYGTPPSHGSSGSIPDPSHGGGGYGTTPAAPWHASPTPSTGSGGYGSSPTTPSHDGGAYGGSTPSHSSGTATPTPFVPVDPNSAGTCDYWRSHPMQIWSALGSWPSSMSHFFGAAGGAAAGGTSSNVSIQDALANTRTDGAGALLREGAAALLNSMTRSGFPYTTDQVRSAFVAAAAGGSDSAAATQAAAFKKANEGSKA
ncbi:protodermal factor 1-like [Lolium rigidum]|uniref:protodermal factor 1-like n=1 Tax=Lolium rigidum TaxID=89674 RepID=UPI001F5C2034|nr:protodermal factor 1-like [Lolium rigidum]